MSGALGPWQPRTLRSQWAVFLVGQYLSMRPGNLMMIRGADRGIMDLRDLLAELSVRGVCGGLMRKGDWHSLPTYLILSATSWRSLSVSVLIVTVQPGKLAAINP